MRQRRGIALYWEPYEKPGFNPKTGQAVVSSARRIRVNDQLPMKEEFERLLCGVIGASEPGGRPDV